MTRALNMGAQTKLTIFLVLLLLSPDLSTGGGASGFRWGGMNLGNRPSGVIKSYEVTAQMKIRRLMEAVHVLDYEKDPGPNPKHEPPKSGGGH